MTAFPDWGQEGRVAVITGATGYLGRALAGGFADAGATLLLTGRSEEALDELAEELGPARDRIHTFAADLTDGAAGERIVGQALVKTGRVDTLVVNAATLADGLFAGLTDYELSQVYEVNLWGALRTLRAALRPMILHRGGSIVIVSSTAAQRPGVGQAAYASSKAALESIVRVTARETAARGIRVNAVAPGLLTGGMATRILDEEFDRARAVIPMRRAGEADEVVPAVLFLASPMSSYITGQVWSIDGGFTA
jgi:NAD(P)-dependent dehydrogenase (short-subunit alcohol dehydrogenase family)